MYMEGKYIHTTQTGRHTHTHTHTSTHTERIGLDVITSHI